VTWLAGPVDFTRRDPERRMRGPSAHQIGPSPSQTAVGVQTNDDPAAITSALKITRSRSRPRRGQDGARSLPLPAAQERLQLLSRQCNWHKRRQASLPDRCCSKNRRGSAVPRSADRCGNRLRRFFRHVQTPARSSPSDRVLRLTQLLLKTS